MGNNIYSVCSCEESKESPAKEQCLVSDQPKIEIIDQIKPGNNSVFGPPRINSSKSFLQNFDDTRHSSLSWNFSSIKPVSFKQSLPCHFTGETVNGKKEGPGKLLFPDGTYYEGNFKEDLYDGKGTLVQKDYNYVGDFVKGRKEGKGKIEYFTGDKKSYEGDWADDKEQGYGVEIYSDGTTYEGYFEKGRKSKKGKLSFKKGGEYSGEFLNDAFHGQGTFKWSETKYYTGEWKSNCIDGFGTFTEGDKMYIGYFEKDLKCGFGANYYKSNKIFVCSKWKEDKIENGIAVIFGEKEGVVKICNNIIEKKYTEEEIEREKIKESLEYKEILKFYKEKLESLKF